tara:strand:- start:4207 stop:4401 length:195 start_codon:yes stop_codon:yes gene_type:complete
MTAINTKYKLKVKRLGKWGDFLESDTNRTPVIFKTIQDAIDEKNKRVNTYGEIYKIEAIEREEL